MPKLPTCRFLSGRTEFLSEVGRDRAVQANSRSECEFNTTSVSLEGVSQSTRSACRCDAVFDRRDAPYSKSYSGMS